MKFKKLKIGLKSVLAVLLVVIVSSCKKEEPQESRPHTVAEFEKIMAADLDIEVLRVTTNTLVAIKKNPAAFEPSVTLQSEFATQTRPKLSQDSLSKVIKTRGDLEKIYAAQSVKNSEILFKLFEDQVASIANFKKNYPEIADLSEKELEAVLLKTFKTKNSSSATSGNKSLGTKTDLVDPYTACNQNYGAAFQSCEDVYYAALALTWTAIALSSEETLGTTALLGLIAMGVNYLVWDNCVVRAGDSWNTCTSQIH